MWMPLNDFYLRIFFLVPGIGGVAGRILAKFFNLTREKIEVKDKYSSHGPIAVCLDLVDFYFAIRLHAADFYFGTFFPWLPWKIADGVAKFFTGT